MSDETADLAPDAEASPEQEVDQLQEALGDDYEDFQTWKADRDNWSKQQNKHNEAAATAAKEAAQARDELLKALASKGQSPESGGAKGPLVPWQQVMSQLGIQDWDEPLTAGQTARIVEYIAQVGDQRFSDLMGELPKDEEGKPLKVSLADAYQKASTAEANYLQLAEKLDDVFTPLEIAQLQEKFDLADEDDIRNAMERFAGDDEFEDKVRAAAEKSHKKAEKLLSKHDKAQRRTRSKASLRAAAARGSAVGGKASANPWGDLKKYNEENPPDWGEAV